MRLLVSRVLGEPSSMEQLLAHPYSSTSSVPADYASVKIQDAILTRLSNDDSIERSLSTFAQEMASSAMILGMP